MEQIQNLPLIELAYQVLADTNEPHYYRDLMKKLAGLRHMDQSEVDEVIARLYTDINIDGRFVCIGDSVWGLRRWYPVERVTERGTSKRFVRKEVVEDDEVEEVEDESELEEEDLIEEEPFAFEDDDVVDEEEFEEESDEFLEESEIEEEDLDEDDQETDEEEEY